MDTKRTVQLHWQTNVSRYVVHWNSATIPPTYVLNEDTQLVIRAIGVSHTACKDEFRRNLRSHSWSAFSFFIIPGNVSEDDCQRWRDLTVAGIDHSASYVVRFTTTVPCSIVYDRYCRAVHHSRYTLPFCYGNFCMRHMGRS